MTDWAETYDQSWAAREAVFAALLEQEDSLARVLARFDNFERGHRLLTKDGEVRYFAKPQAPDPIGALNPTTQQAFHGQMLAASDYFEFRRDRLLADLSQTADCVIELGSGYGRQVFAMWLAGANAQARYVAAEPSAIGRRLTQRLAALEPHLKLECHPFDFRSATLPAVAPEQRVLLFSSWASMYAAPLDRSLFRAIAAHPGPVTCVFIEPFGFQVNPHAPFAAQQRGQMEAQGMNTDFFEALREEGAAAGLELVSVAPDLFGRTDETLQLASVIIAEKAGQDACAEL
ncbi:MAG: hypothetical protein HQL42_05100 [Alphaproteobacteria bacterium]|nr:hypothetical protein [Alphaproteobacteria bacterium]